MDKMELAARAIAELAPLGNGLGLRSAMQVAETDGLAANMLTALLGHELVAGHATMMKLSAKIDRWLALVADDRLAEDQERGTREAVRLAIAASRLTERYRAGLLSLARLRGWDAAGIAGATAAAGRRVDPADLLAAFGEDGLDDDPGDGPGDGPKGGTRALVQALRQMRAVNSQLSAALGNGHANGAAKPNGAPMPNGAHTPSAPYVNRGTLRHGNPSGDFLAAPRCGARTRAGCPCRQPAMGNGRCRLHGGKSTGARTTAGLARVRANRLVHGARTAEILELRSAAARHGRNLRTLARLANAAEPQSERSTPCPATPRRVARG
ncbi:MAG: HGGxSTG domain-containing protein [Dongiaceae bacterium]